MRPCLPSLTCSNTETSRKVQSHGTIQRQLVIVKGRFFLANHNSLNLASKILTMAGIPAINFCVESEKMVQFDLNTASRHHDLEDLEKNRTSNAYSPHIEACEVYINQQGCVDFMPRR